MFSSRSLAVFFIISEWLQYFNKDVFYFAFWSLEYIYYLRLDIYAEG